MLRLSRREEDFESLHSLQDKAYFNQLVMSVRNCDSEGLPMLLRNYPDKYIPVNKMAQLLGEVTCPRPLSVLLDYMDDISQSEREYYPQYVLLSYIEKKYYNTNTIQLVLYGFRKGITGTNISNILSSLLRAATQNKDFLVVDIILDEFNVPPEEYSYFFDLTLIVLAHKDDFETFKYVVEKYNINLKELSIHEPDSILILLCPIINDNPEMLKYVLDKGIRGLDKKVFYDIFHFAVKKDDYSIIDSLYNRDKDNLMVLLDLAAEYKFFDIITYLIDKYDIDLSKYGGRNNNILRTIFHVAVSNNRKDIIDLFIEHGYDYKPEELVDTYSEKDIKRITIR